VAAIAVLMNITVIANNDPAVLIAVVFFISWSPNLRPFVVK
jgi:hypothetical protein